jgi:AcrR family transcriptional regulator
MIMSSSVPTGTVLDKMGTARDELLERIVAEVAVHGLADRSMRELAAGVGSSHRMLLYHFGSRDGLVAAIVAATEAAQRDALRELAVDADSPADLVRRLWTRVSSPELRPFVRLFFETLATQARTPGAATDPTADWLEAVRGLGPVAGGYDDTDTRLGIAVMRGLLVDVLATGDVAAAAAALERYLSLAGAPATGRSAR